MNRVKHLALTHTHTYVFSLVNNYRRRKKKKDFVFPLDPEAGRRGGCGVCLSLFLPTLKREDPPTHTHTHTPGPPASGMSTWLTLLPFRLEKVLHTQTEEELYSKKRGRENGLPDQTHAAAFLYYSTFKLFFSLVNLINLKLITSSLLFFRGR